MKAKPVVHTDVTVKIEDIERDDGGQAFIAVVEPDAPRAPNDPRGDNGFFIELHSWYTGARMLNEHPEMAALKGKRIRLVIEILD